MNAPTNAEEVMVLRELLSPKIVAEFNNSIEGARWQERRNEAGAVAALSPTTHGAVTGRICDYFSHPELLAEIHRLTGIRLHHYIGSAIQLQPGDCLTFQHSRFPLAMVVNLSAWTLDTWQLGSGDAGILGLGNGRQHPWPAQTSVCCLVDGYFV